MLQRLFSRRGAEVAEESGGEPAPPLSPGGLGLGLLWFLAFLFSAALIAAAAFAAYGQLATHTGALGAAALKAQGERLGAEVNGRLRGLAAVVERAAVHPSLAAVMTAGDPAAIAAQAEALAASIPDALRVRLLPPGGGVPDETTTPRLGYAGLDLARRAEQGQRPPMEFHWAGAPDRHVAVARAIPLPDQSVAGVLLASIDARALERWLDGALPEGGYAEVRQSADDQAVILARGDAGRKAGGPSGSVRLGGTAWELVYWLPQTPVLSRQSQIAFFTPFAGAVAVLGLLFTLLAVADARLVRADLGRLVTHVFDLLQRKRRAGRAVRLREFRKAVQVLDAAIHLPPPRPTHAPVPEDPLFLPEDTIKVEEVGGEGDKR